MCQDIGQMPADQGYDELRHQLVQAIAETLAVPHTEVDAEKSFRELGLDSIMSLTLLQRLSRSIGRELPVTLLWTYPTVAALASFLASGEQPLPEHGVRSTVSTEPIAIVGISCRMPGGVNDPESFWQLLVEGRSGITEVPADRWDVDQYYDPDPSAPGKMATRWGGFLDQVDCFDSLFFGISPREAADMDPQQRMALELTWQALEDAGLIPDVLRGSRTGVFFGTYPNDYCHLRHDAGSTSAITQYTATGLHHSILSNRVSYVLGLQGPSMTVHTACSSSLVATHLACQSLRGGESDLSLAGGFQVMAHPFETIAMSALGALSPDGQCYTFDARANGYVRGEGGGVVVLQRLSQARRDGRRIYAVIRGSAVNNDGQSNGLTAPNLAAQVAVMEEACRSALVEPASIQYVQLHGTGTPLGDPIEAQSVGTVYGSGTEREQPLQVSSVKTNIGHLEGAAGITGLLTAALQIHHRRLVPSLCYETANPHIDLEGLGLQVVTEARPWPDDRASLRAGVTSMGFGGTNAHTILESEECSTAIVLPLSAQTAEELKASAEQMRASLCQAPEHLPLQTACGAIRSRGDHDRFRLALIARSRAKLITELERAAAGETPLSAIEAGTASAATRPVLVFTGDGAQWYGMGHSLMREQPVFRRAFERCDEAFRRIAQWSLLDELYAAPPRSRVEAPGAQDSYHPLIVALEIASAELWRSWGIEPAVVIGHSVGEVAAARAAGILTLEDAMRLVHWIGRVYHEMSIRGDGFIALANRSPEDLKEVLEPYRDEIHIAGWNDPDSSLLAGERQSLERLLAKLRGGGTLCRPIFDAPAHCAQMAAAVSQAADQLAPIAPDRGRLPLYSTTLGRLVDGRELDASYWHSSLCCPVRFAQGIEHLARRGHACFVEVGPHRALARAIEVTLAHNDLPGRVIASQKRLADGLETMLGAVGELFALGADVQWSRIAARVTVNEPTVAATAPCSAVHAADPARVSVRAAETDPLPQLVLLSAKTPAALDDQVRGLARYVRSHPRARLCDIAQTLACRRSHFSQRLALVVSDRSELLDALEAASPTTPHPAMIRGEALQPGKVAFLLTGQGSQYAGMGRELYRDHPVFRDAVDRCAATLDHLIDPPLLRVMMADRGTADAALLDRTGYTQPALFVLEYALYQLWTSWGVRPAYLLGHSVGELVAACVAGVFSLEDGLRLIAARGRLMDELPATGAMASIQAPEQEVKAKLGGYDATVSIAAVNSPEQTVISGIDADVMAIKRIFDSQGIKTSRLRVSHAFHSPLMEPMLRPFEEVARSLEFRDPSIPIVSNLSGALAGDELATPAYWVDHVRGTVRAADGLRRLSLIGVSTFVELGPQPTFLGMVMSDLPDDAHRIGLPSLRKGQSEWRVLLGSLGQWYAQGGDLDWRALGEPFAGNLLSLPAYPFQRERHWINVPRSSARSQRQPTQVSSHLDHPLLGSSFCKPGHPKTWFWERVLSLDEHPWLADHRIEEAVVVPAAAFVDMSLAAAREILGDKAIDLHEVQLQEALVLTKGIEVSVQIALTEQAGGAHELRISRRVDGEQASGSPWQVLINGRIAASRGLDAPGFLTASSIRSRCRTARSQEQVYERLATIGLPYGRAFRGLAEILAGEGEVMCRVALPAEAEPWTGFQIHPALLDACIQAVLVAELPDEPRLAGPAVPVAIERAVLWSRPPVGESLWCHARVGPRSDKAPGLLADLTIACDDSSVVMEIHGLETQHLDHGARQVDPLSGLMFETSWNEVAPLPAVGSGQVGRWLLLADRRGVADRVQQQLEAQGGSVIRIDAVGADEEQPTGAAAADPLEPESVAEQVGAAILGRPPLQGVLHLWGIDDLPMNELGPAELTRAGERGWAGALHVVQALAAAELRDPPRLVLVTVCSQAVGADGSVAPEQALLWGLGGVARSEHQELRGLRIDLASPESEDEIGALVREILADSREDQVALRGGSRWVARLTRASWEDSAVKGAAAADQGIPLAQADATYLVTGGLGGLGLSLASWMAANGAGHLVLVGREGVTTDEQRATISQMQAAGARVTVAEGDVADRERLSELMDNLSGSAAPLRGVFHAAGLLDDGLLTAQSVRRLRNVMAPKVAGAWNLHELSVSHSLDHFILYSSATVLLGAPGQASYVAANCWLDALAHHRRHQGLPATSLNWGLFSGVGLAAGKNDPGARLDARGLRSLTREEGLQIIERVMRSPMTQVAPMRFVVQEWIDHYPAAADWPFVSELPAESRAANRLQKSRDINVFQQAAVGERPDVAARDQVKAQLAFVLGTSADLVGDTTPLKELGIDSLTGLELRNRLQSLAGIKLPTTLIWSHPTVAEIAELMLASISAEGTKTQVAEPSFSDEMSDTTFAQSNGLDAGHASPEAPPDRLARVWSGASPRVLSPAEERLWFLDRLMPASSMYNLSFGFHITGRLSRDALQRSVQRLYQRHSVLRTVYGEMGGQRWAMPAGSEATLSYLDLSELEPSARDQELARRVEEDGYEHLDLSNGPLLRATLMRLGEQEHHLHLTVHHIVSDGSSVFILKRDLASLYGEEVNGAETGVAGTRLPELAISYGDFAVWQRARSEEASYAEDLAWWAERLRDLPPLALPARGGAPRVPSHAGASLSFALTVEQSNGLGALARREGFTLFVLLLSAWAVLLHRYSGQEDFAVGTISAGRDQPELAELVGLLVRTMVLRVEVSGEEAFTQLLGKVEAVIVEALARQDVSFSDVVEALGAERMASLTPLIQSCFVLESMADPIAEAAGTSWRSMLDRPDGAVEGSAKFDLTLVMGWSSDRLYGVVEYATDLFEAEVIQSMLDAFLCLLEGILADSEQPVADLPIHSEAELLRLHQLNDKPIDAPETWCIHTLFEEQVARRPAAVALLWGHEQMSYAELDRRASRLAHRLIELGVGPEQCVGLCMERSASLVVGLLGILKAGGAYLPLDPEYPAERLAFMLDDAAVKVMLIEGAGEQMAFDGVTTLDLADPGAGLAAYPAHAPASQVFPSSLAYVIYTSGSTGRPKGVAVEHRNVASLVKNASYACLDESKTILHAASISFDAATFEVWGALLNGGRCVLMQRGVPSASSIQEAIQGYSVDTMWLTSSLFNLMIDEMPDALVGLDQLLIGGEALSVSHVRRFRESFPEISLINGYGPTECTTFACSHPVPPASQVPLRSIPIGGPIQNTKVYVLDAAGRMAPTCVAGELWIGGAGVSRGYLRRPELTEERFVPDPFSKNGARIYRTGDLVRWLPDGTLEYVGRVDHQTKIRGFRVEPGEIEAALCAVDNVSEALVMDREDRPGDRRLVAYYRGPADAGELRAELRKSLPSHMVPNHLVRLERLPLTASGKVDRLSLPSPASVRSQGRPGSEDARQHDDELESQLLSMLRELLGDETVGLRESFFDAGAHSLLLARFQTRILNELGQDLRLVELFAHPTINDLATRLRELGGEARPAPVLKAASTTAESLQDDHSIAVVGLSCALPGAPDATTLWSNIAAGVVSIRPPGEEELREAGIPVEILTDARFVAAHGMLDDRDLFDASFFGIEPGEAAGMDPQQRLLLEHAWTALEDAGLSPGAARSLGREVGVYVSASSFTVDGEISSSASDDGSATHWASQSASDYITMIGRHREFIATRTSYLLGLQGPSMLIQTACSSSLVAMHVACQALRLGECEVALAGGVSISPATRWAYLHQKGFIHSSSGRCRAFDASSDGTVGGSGVGVVVLKRLADARRDGDRIHAAVLGSAINNDGERKVGYMTPSVAGQLEVLTRAYLDAGIEPSTVGYVECHGTGTQVGDPMEVEALRQHFDSGEPGGASSPAGTLALGSRKANLGHLDAAAGIAALISTVLALKAKERPPAADFSRLNPKIDLRGSRLLVSAASSSWPCLGAPRRAGINALGIGGTNAHVVLEEAPTDAPVADRARNDGCGATYLLPLSARQPEALRELATRFREHLAARPEQQPRDICSTAATGRGHLAHRLCAIGANRAELGDALAAFASGQQSPNIVTGSAPSEARSRVAFLFSGQGSQHPGMGKELYDRHQVFRYALDECAAYLDHQLGAPLLETLFAEEGSDEAELIHQTEHTQPALFALGYALSRLWRSWGVSPDVVIGHSVGELTAACVAGVLSLEHGCRLVAARGRLMGSLPRGGAMVSLRLPESRVANAVAPCADRVSVATVNGPAATVISGEERTVAEIAEELASEGAGPKMLKVSHAFHSPLMEPMLEELEAVAKSITLRPPELPLISNLTGAVAGNEVCEAGYWRTHARQAVRFYDGLGSLADMGELLCVELGPHPVLVAIAAEALPSAAMTWLPSMRRDVDGDLVALESLGRLWANGSDISWSEVMPDGRVVDLPTYPFQRQRFRTGQGSTTLEICDPETASEEPVAVELLADAVRCCDHSQALDLVLQAAKKALAQVMRTEPETIPDDVVLPRLGCDSLRLVELRNQLETIIGEPIEMRLLVCAPTVLQLAQSLADTIREDSNGEGGDSSAPWVTLHSEGRSEDPLLVCVDPRNGATARLIGFPYAGGGASVFYSWAERIPREIELWAIRLPGRESRMGEAAVADIDLLADQVAAALGPLQDRPCVLFGHSLGGLLAFHAVRRMRQKSLGAPAHLVLSACLPATALEGSVPVADLSEAQLLELLSGYDGTPHEVLENEELLQLMLPALRADLTMASSYSIRPEPLLECAITAIAGSNDQLCRPEQMKVWRGETTGEFSVKTIAGEHFFLHTNADGLFCILDEIFEQTLGGILPVVTAGEPDVSNGERP